MHNAEMKSQNLLSALVIDHDDSFTENIKKWLSKKFNVTLIHHLEIKLSDIKLYDLIILSPGPLSPNNYPKSLNFLLSLDPSKSVLGICLGMQMMTVALHGQVKTYSPPRHGKTTPLEGSFVDHSVYEHPFSLDGIQVARYHSMYCDLPENEFDIIATSENLPMWIIHKFKKWMGFQFHPESFMTEKSDLFLDKIYQWVVQNQRMSV